MSTRALAAAVLLLLVALGVLVWLVPGRRGAPEPTAIEDVLARERAAAQFADGAFDAARESLAPLVARQDASPRDLVAAAAIEMRSGDASGARAFLDRARERSPADPAAHYVLARIAIAEGDFERAEPHLRRALEGAPGDLPTRLSLGNVLYELGEVEAAEELYRSILDVGLESGGSWYVSAAYRLSRLAVFEGDEDLAAQTSALWEQLEERGFKAVSPSQLDEGVLARLSPPPPEGNRAGPPPELPAFVADAPILEDLAGAHVISLADVDGDRELDIVASTPTGLWLGQQDLERRFTARRIIEGPVALARGLDLGNDDDLDFVLARGTSLELVVAEEIEQWQPEWKLHPEPLAELPAAPASLAALDHDHDGDLDLLVVGPFGARLLRNDGAANGGSFVDVTAEAGLSTDTAFTWCTFEDFDGDQDVDLLMGGPDALLLADNLRGGRFADRTATAFGEAKAFPREPLVADFDGDARPDVLVPGEPATLWRQGRDGRFMPAPTRYDVPPKASAILESDLDLDGSIDVVWRPADALAAGARAFGLAVERPFEIGRGEIEPGPARGPIALGDLDRDLDVDLVEATPEGIVVHRNAGPVGQGARLSFFGTKDNRRAVGSIVEARIGPLYRRVYWRGDPVLIGGGAAPWIDVLRITWPNGVVQTELDVEFGDWTMLDETDFGVQEEGLIGSCPFLYTWNGETFEFVSDVLGVTPLGLPMAPGVLVPPDHDEYVLVRGDQLAERAGELAIAVTEELREVTYLDRVRLDVVDHAAGTHVWPNERFTFPPFPEPKLHVTRTELAPLSATGSDGGDWTAALAERDGRHAVPFRPLAPQFLGLAEPHWLELTFAPEALAGATRLRLVLTGWFYWTDASVNIAAARTPGVAFVPPTLERPSPGGGWVPAGPPIGFPAGKTKSMVIDVTEVLGRADPRLRISSTLRLYWDAIRLAVDGEDEAVRVQSLEPIRARLGFRGFSRALEAARDDVPEHFVWDELEPRPRWNPHPGRYTRYGDVLALLGDIDDRFVILGAGDALWLAFDAKDLAPPPPGHVRDYVVFLDGWAKDRDPNTLEALEVEPLPFHGMRSYPYGEDEQFPAGEEHRAWRREWNTRVARPLIVPLSPARELEWLAER